MMSITLGDDKTRVVLSVTDGDHAKLHVWTAGEQKTFPLTAFDLKAIGLWAQDVHILQRSPDEDEMADAIEVE